MFRAPVWWTRTLAATVPSKGFRARTIGSQAGLAFFNAAALFLIAGAEFLAMILVIVYVGAVAVLFLFVVMMLDIDFARLREGFQRYAPVGAVVGGILFLELVLVLGSWTFADQADDLRLSPNPGATITNTEAIGRILYTDYVYLFQASGLILLSAEASTVSQNAAFRFKMLMLLVGLINVAVFHARFSRHLKADTPIDAARPLALISLTAWILVLLAGRAIAYV